MILRNRLQRITYSLGELIGLFAGGLVAGFGFIMSAKPATYSVWPAPLANWMAQIQANSLTIWVSIGIGTFLGWYLRKRGDPWAWDKLHEQLDAIQDVAFQGFPNHIKDHHRVTLFKYRKWYWRLSSPMAKSLLPWHRGRWPWSGWLVPVLRSGRTSQNTRAVFLAPDNGDEAEGVAGYAWASNRVFVVSDLPQVTGTSRDSQIVKYSERTFCPAPVVRDYIARERPLPRSIGAIPIEVNHKPWGVLVLDSRDDQGVTVDLVDKLSLMVNSISQLLEKAK